MSKARIAVLISGGGSNLQALIDASRTHGYPGDIVGVISDQPLAYGLERAARADIPTTLVSRQEFETRAAFDQALADAVDALRPDIVVLAGFMRIVRGAMVTRYAGRMLNIHPALLPKYKGLDTYARCLAAGDPAHGTTVHFVSAELDAGPPVLQAELAVAADDTVASLTARVQALEHVIYPMAVRWLAERRLELREDGAWLDRRPLPEPFRVRAEDLSV
ncbi:MAG: phosphoribosylglycinamide formyltransferase [Pseudomonadota bacterium]